MQPPGVPAHCLYPPQTVLHSVDDRGCNLVSTYTMKVGVGVGVRRADRGFNHIAPDIPSSRHRKLPTPQKGGWGVG